MNGIGGARRQKKPQQALEIRIILMHIVVKQTAMDTINVISASKSGKT
jgi:hypothetical protein